MPVPSLLHNLVFLFSLCTALLHETVTEDSVPQEGLSDKQAPAEVGLPRR